MALPPFPLVPTIPNNTVVSNISGQTAAPAANPLTQVLDSILGSAQGSVIFRSATSWTALAPGSPGQILHTGGNTGVPYWLALQTGDIAGGSPGAILFHGSHSWEVLPPGIAGRFLQTTEGPYAPPEWGQPVPTGAMMPFLGSTARAGWVLASGGTIGDTSSGATARANQDTLDLYTLLYFTYPDSQAPVSGGRGSGPTSDFGAHKTIRLPDLRGRVVAGKDDMGGTAAGRLTAGASGVAGNVLGATGGEQAHTLTAGEIANHTHHVTAGQNPPQAGQTGRATWGDGVSVGTFATGGVDGGAGGAHNNTQPTIVLNYIIKL